MPTAWKKANIILIPKTQDWNKNVDKTRPITLIETLRKVYTKILTNRIESVCRLENILQDNNCSVLKGTSTHCPISIIKNLCEDARASKDKELWIVLQDMRKAYDSVGWTALYDSLTRIKMNDKYIRMLQDLHQNRHSAVITAHGLTDAHHVQDGLDQGETHAPILWRIFYDPLLCAVKNNTQANYVMTDIPETMAPG